MNKIVECVPNFSEGRDLEKLERILLPLKSAKNCTLLDYSSDKDHNRTVVTVMGEPQSVKNAILEAMGAAIREIDMNGHKGGLPRMGAVDVVPFIPIKDMTMEEAALLARETAAEAAARFELPVYLYEKAAASPASPAVRPRRKCQSSRPVSASSAKASFGAVTNIIPSKTTGVTSSRAEPGNGNIHSIRSCRTFARLICRSGL
jgi:glutamate formiminotransferase